MVGKVMEPRGSYITVKTKQKNPNRIENSFWISLYYSQYPVEDVKPGTILK